MQFSSIVSSLSLHFWHCGFHCPRQRRMQERNLEGGVWIALSQFSAGNAAEFYSRKFHIFWLKSYPYTSAEASDVHRNRVPCSAADERIVAGPASAIFLSLKHSSVQTDKEIHLQMVTCVLKMRPRKLKLIFAWRTSFSYFRFELLLHNDFSLLVLRLTHMSHSCMSHFWEHLSKCFK